MAYRCKWCGREYGPYDSTATYYKDYYCSGRCEAEAKRSKLEAERSELEAKRSELEAKRSELEAKRLKAETRAQSGGSSNNGYLWLWGVILVVASFIYIRCSDPQEEWEEENVEKTETSHADAGSHRWWRLC